MHHKTCSKRKNTIYEFPSFPLFSKITDFHSW
jgi:hypothetical protein